MKKKNIAIVVGTAFLSALLLVVAVPFLNLGIRTAKLNADYSYLKEDEVYSLPAEVEDVYLVEQKVSCGYATIQMLSAYYGSVVTEEDLETKNNGAISTASSNGFLKEINESIPRRKFAKKSFLKNDAFLKEIHDSLKNGNPVAIEWAAKLENEWTLHFSVVAGLDILNDNVHVYNPYGYEENLKVQEFLDRTSFKAYEGMPLFLNFGFAFGAFDKNVLFYAVK